MSEARYIDSENRVLNPFARSLEPQEGDRGWGQLCTMKRVDADRRAIEADLSTDFKDRYGEIIEPRAFADFLPQFNQRNAFLDSHDHEKQIGHWEDMRVTQHTFEGWAVFDRSPNNPDAARVWDLHTAQPKAHRETFSVGFIGHAWEMRVFETPAGRERVRVWTVAEPVEGSSVAVPANPQAAAKALARFTRAVAAPPPTGDAGELINQLKELLSPEPGSELCLLIESVVERTLRAHGGTTQQGGAADGEDGKEILAQLERMLAT